MKLKILISATVLGAVACVSHSPKESLREPSGKTDFLDGRSPLTQKTFLQEFDAAKPGSDPEYSTREGYTAGEFFRWMRASPVAAFEDLRRRGDVHFLGNLKSKDGTKKPAFVVISAEAVDAVLKDSKTFSLRGYVDKKHSRVNGTLVARTPLTELWDRVVLQEGKEVLREMIRRTAAQTLENEIYVGKNLQGKPFARLELVNHFARLVPAQVNANFYGVAIEGFAARDVARALQDDLIFNPDNNPIVAAAAADAAKSVEKLVDDLLDGKRSVPSLSRWAAFNQEAQRMELDPSQASRQERHEISRAVQALIGQTEMVQSAVVETINQLIEKRQLEEARARALGDDESALSQVVHEAMRWSPTQSISYRWAEQEATLPNGTKIPAGSLVVVGTQGAMFDPATVSDPLRFRADRPLPHYRHFAQSGLSQPGDDVAELATLGILKELLRQPGLRRAEGHVGQVDSRRVFVATLIKTELFRYSFPEQFTIEYDVPSLRPGVFEIPNKDYAYDEYLQDFDREEFRACLGGYEQNDKLTKKWAATLSNREVTRLNVNQENKHLLYCRLPKVYRTCAAVKKLSILRPEDESRHRQTYERCKNSLSGTEQAFYRQVFFKEPLNRAELQPQFPKAPLDPRLDFEKELKFYDRFRLRESMMNPIGFSKDPIEMYFYIHLNIDFRMCLGAPVVKNELTGGLLGTPKEQQFNKCKDGFLNPQTFKVQGKLTEREKYYYEKIMLKK